MVDSGSLSSEDEEGCIRVVDADGKERKFMSMKSAVKAGGCIMLQEGVYEWEGGALSGGIEGSGVENCELYIGSRVNLVGKRKVKLTDVKLTSRQPEGDETFLHINNCGDVTLDNCCITSPTRPLTITNSTSVTIKNCFIRQRVALSITDTMQIHLFANTISGDTTPGITTYGSTGTIRGNKLHYSEMTQLPLAIHASGGKIAV